MPRVASGQLSSAAWVKSLNRPGRANFLLPSTMITPQSVSSTFVSAACLLALAFTSCAHKGDKAGSGSGAEGDYVTGSALPDRQEGVSFLGANVDRNKFAPIYFGFDSVTV